MNEFVYAEFLVYDSDGERLLEELSKLGDDFEMVKCDPGPESINNIPLTTMCSGKIRAEAVTFIMLGSSFLKDHMYVSFIDTALKDKYRGNR